MAAIQCKMCGGMVKLPPGITSGECPYCGTLTTFPKVDDDRRENLYNRAEHFRRSGDFDKAVAAYESILNDDSSDPEAYWGIAISRFGIEYVEDPATRERIPTCHRVQYESFTSDPDYLSALEHSAGTAEHEIYEREGARIAEIQKNILKISAQEKPFDIFICYKESTDGGTRTKDSAIAQDIYYQLTNAGYKVFFARITLESKLGQQYEPYIFAALNSAKVMLVIGSKAEYFNAVWVKNEWSRFLALKKKDRSRLIIPCYRDMDPYDLPEELSLFQSQDMSKIGFIQDILHGIKKVVKTGAAPAVAQTSSASPAANPADKFAALEERIRMFLADKEWDNAVEYCNRILDEDPKNGKTHFFMTLAKFKCATVNDLILNPSDFTNDSSFRHALNFSAGEDKEKLKFIADAWDFVAGTYRKKSEKELQEFVTACDHFLDVPDAKDGPRRIILEWISACRKKYNEAIRLEHQKKYETAASLFVEVCMFTDDAEEHFCECTYQQGIRFMVREEYSEAESYFRKCKDYKDSNQRAADCRTRMEEIEEEERKRKIRCVLVIVVSLISLVVFLAINASCQEQAREEAEEKARQEWIAAEKARQEAEEIARQEAEEKARQERIAAEKARLEAEEKARQERIAAAEKARQERIAAEEKARQEIADNMVKVEAGRFLRDDEKGVTLTKAYWIGKYEVTQIQYEAVMGNNPSEFKGDNRPVECVSWHDAKTFCDKLNELYRDKLPAGYRFDLPTEAQWEFAARGGNKSKGYKYSGSNDIAKVAWYNYNSGDQTHGVGQKQPNELGLYDMTGNVREWCRDWHDWHDYYSKDTVTDPTGPQKGSRRVVRGGGWHTSYFYDDDCRVARRDYGDPDSRFTDRGFRLALVPID